MICELRGFVFLNQKSIKLEDLRFAVWPNKLADLPFADEGKVAGATLCKPGLDCNQRCMWWFQQLPVFQTEEHDSCRLPRRQNTRVRILFMIYRFRKGRKNERLQQWQAHNSEVIIVEVAWIRSIYSGWLKTYATWLLTYSRTGAQPWNWRFSSFAEGIIYCDQVSWIRTHAVTIAIFSLQAKSSECCGIQ
jgi:hypothetical protein